MARAHDHEHDHHDVGLPLGLVVVKQGSPAASEEYYAAVLAENLHEASGRTMWFTPRTRALEVHHEEALAIKRAIRTSPFTVPEEAYRATMYVDGADGILQGR